MPKLGPFPSKEAHLNLYFRAAVAHLIANAARLLLTDDNQAALTSDIEQWNILFPASQNSSVRTTTITQKKNALKEKLIVGLRLIYSNIPPMLLGPADRNALNITDKKVTKTASPVPHTKPIARINTSNRLRHKISYTNEDGSLAKPYLSRGCQIWYKIGAPASDPNELSYLCTSSVTPFTHEFHGEHAGKPVYYWLRWENTRGKTGPWSSVVMATITG